MVFSEEDKLFLKVVKNNDLEKCKELIKGRVNINIKDNWGHTALIYASSRGYKELCSLLLDDEADVNIRDKNGWTALTGAYRHEYKEIISLLIGSGCNYSSYYQIILYNRSSIPTFRTFMIENVRNQKDIKLKDLIGVVPEEILDDINNKSISYCTKCHKHFYYYKYEIKLKAIYFNEIINVKVHCL